MPSVCQRGWALQAAAVEGRPGGRPGAPVQQRGDPRRHPAAAVLRPQRALLHRHVQPGRRDEPQAPAGDPRLRGQAAHLRAQPVPEQAGGGPAHHQDVPLPRHGGAPDGRHGARRHREPAAARVRAQEHRLRGGHRGVRGPRVEGDAQQRRPAVQALQAGAADERGHHLVRGDSAGAVRGGRRGLSLLAVRLRRGGREHPLHTEPDAEDPGRRGLPRVLDLHHHPADYDSTITVR